jgi:hypothetical protein
MFQPLAALSTLAALTLVLAGPLSAQPAGSTKAADAPAIVGTWTGTATVPLGDSTIVVPVSYTFTQSATGLGGVAFVPGQGQGTISNVVRDGSRVRFRVAVTANNENRLLEHDGTIGADGAMEGIVNMDNKPLAKFKIAQAKAAPK